jgi:hypothetical protein
LVLLAPPWPPVIVQSIEQYPAVTVTGELPAVNGMGPGTTA